MKKLFALLLALMMVLSLAACGGSDDAEDEGGEDLEVNNDSAYGVSNDGTDMSDEQLAAITSAYNQVAPIYNEVYVNAENNGWMEDETTAAEINAVSAILGTIGEALTTDLSLLEGGDYDAMPGVMLELEEPLQELLERVSEPYDVG